MFQGVYTALVTPFKSGEIDYGSFKKLIKFQLDGGIEGLVVNGTTGESPTLTTEEQLKLVEVASVEVGGQVPVLFGAGTNCTARTIGLAQKAQKYDIDGLLIVVPYYNKPPQNGLIAHFTAVADNTDKPIVLYNVPSRTVVSLEPESVIALAKHRNIAGIKEADPDVNNFAKYKNIVAPEFSLLSGDDESSVSFCLLGGHGVISVCSNIAPRQMVDWITKARNREESVRGPFRQQSVWIKKLFFRANPIPVKAALQMLGIIESRELRLPLMALTELEISELRYILKEFSSCL